MRTVALPSAPSWPTMMRNRWPDGRVLGVDGSMWLFRTVPLGPVDDARTDLLSGMVAEPVMAAFEEIATLAGPIRLSRRALAKSAYRDVHVLMLNMPKQYVPATNDELGEFQRQVFPDKDISRKVLLLGVRLVAKMADTSIAGSVRHFVDVMAYGGLPTEEFARDFRDVDAAMVRCGLRVPTEEEMLLAGHWWNQGGQPDVPYLPHPDHIHVFHNIAGAQAAARLDSDCTQWATTTDSHTISLATSTSFDLPYVAGISAAARWASRLVTAGAVMISMRGKVEPARVTREELRRMRKNYISDIEERYREGKMSRAEQEETLSDLAEVEAFYAGQGTPTLIETSTIIGFTGRDERAGYDPTEIGRASNVSLSSMLNIQDRALAETMLTSPVMANPHRRDLPCQAIAYSGLPGLSVVGDRSGALLGFTERDSQPAYIEAMAAVDADQIPICLVVGQSGSGKSVLMTWLATQFAKTRNQHGEHTPVLIFDPKQESDFCAVVEAAGGTTYSLDSLARADGVFDSIRFAAEPSVGVEMAHSMLMHVNPWGPSRSMWETPLLKALNYGVANGATCTLQALEIAERDRQAPSEMVQPVRDAAEASPMFLSLCGRDPGGTALRAAGGITYVRVGNAHLDLPANNTPPSEQGLQQRVAVALVRAIAYGGMMAMTGRQGVLMLDEAWVFTGAGRTEMERIGRLARSQNVLPMMFTQRVTDALDAGLEGYISRGLILPITDQNEAVAACRLFKLEPTPERIGRLTAAATLGSQGGTDQAEAPNWNSMRALRDPVTRQVLRGAIGIYADVTGRAVPAEISIPPSVLSLSSTNRLDRLAASRLAAGQAAPSPVRPQKAPQEPATGAAALNDW